MVGRNSAIAAGVCGALFIGYCIYFDRKRRSDPNFKNRLRERRKKQKLAKERAGLSKLPDLKDAEAVQKFFLEEIQLGEELLAQESSASPPRPSLTLWKRSEPDQMVTPAFLPDCKKAHCTAGKVESCSPKPISQWFLHQKVVYSQRERIPQLD
ncbi:mitochondrial import receptor subunit TOM20 homolog isoform X1 [Neofelis nebulosa]|uniref:mitochondrial import receptor subunit TOM20 homolog isoform X1 n=1 Tax=Panthera uncia TaxID=29064 RepID=UPI0020FFF404|nr:mitochondrial import receptor subunit TOM20 homolog isoform X1 [Panthera uncia]XP_058552174.1 mitochondrial import receptor subunit TOM20 homolog isoform X1 [Neofelis nebulosa]